MRNHRDDGPSPNRIHDFKVQHLGDSAMEMEESQRCWTFDVIGPKVNYQTFTQYLYLKKSQFPLKNMWDVLCLLLAN